jgi:hypothetical protein
MAAEAAEAASTAVVVAVFMEAVVVASTAVVAEATEAVGTTARPAAAATAAGTTIRCHLAAHIPRDVLATPTAQPVTEDMRRATVATAQLAVVQA